MSIALTGSARVTSGSLLSLAIRDKRYGSERELSVNAPHFDALHAIHNYQNDRLVLVGSSAEGTRTAIVELESGRVLDSFLASSPQVSPDARYVAFRSHEASPGRDRYLVYDVAKPTARARGSSREQSWHVGYLVFPRDDIAPRVAQEPEPGSASDRRARSLASKITWLDNAHFAFADLSRRRGKLVVIDLTRGVTFPRVAQIPYARNSSPRIKRLELIERLAGDRWRLRLSFAGGASAPDGWLDVTVDRKHFAPLSPRR